MNIEFKDVYQTLHQQLSDMDYFLKDSVEEDCPSPEWAKAKALYDLFMFDQAVVYFQEVIDRHPDFIPARIYLSHALIAQSHYEQARYQLLFVLDTAENEHIQYLAAHALGCMEGMEHKHEKADYYLQKIDLNEVREEWKPWVLFNHAQALYHLDRHEECIEKLIDYYRYEPDDWQAPFMLGKASQRLGDEETGLAFWMEALQLQENTQLLQEMARYFEQHMQHQIAVQCYERMFRVDPYCIDVHAWFGLAWNYGLNGAMDKSKSIFIKALSLFPDHLELKTAYTWMLLHWKQREQAEKSMQVLTIKHAHHPLVRGLRALARGHVEDAVDVLQQWENDRGCSDVRDTNFCWN